MDVKYYFHLLTGRLTATDIRHHKIKQRNHRRRYVNGAPKTEAGIVSTVPQQKMHRRAIPPQQKKTVPKNPFLKLLYLYGPSLFLPAALLFQEVFFHVYMKLSIKYLPIYALFAIAAGMLFSLFANHFSKNVNHRIACIITGLSSLIFCIEIVCKAVLQQYYQLLSTAETAANNKLMDYFGAILTGILDNFFGLLLMLLPFIFLVVWGKHFFSYRPKPLLFAGFTLGAATVLHVLALICVNLPWSGDFVPKMLYSSDTNIEDQVEQLGILTMLRLDVKHTLFGASYRPSVGTDEFDQISALHNTPTPEASITPAAPSSGEEAPTPTELPTDTSPNILDIDFDAASANENEETQWLSKYFKSVTPTNKNPYTGMFKDYNVIFITAEGFSGYMIDKELTPTLYKLTHEGFVFNNFYTALHYTSTSGGEFQNLTGLYPKNGNPASLPRTGTLKTKLPLTLVQQLNKKNYTSIGYHFNGNMYKRNLSHPNLGYEWKQGKDVEMEYDEFGERLWPQSDYHMIESTIDEYINRQPFNIYYLTISGHLPYAFSSGDDMAMRNKAVVEKLPYSNHTKAYLAANYELEKALTYLVERLEQAGIADKTLLVMSPDHIPYNDVDVLEELTGEKFGKSADFEQLRESNANFEVYHSSLVIWSASMKEPVPVNKICCQVDILPTVSNLLGLEYDSRLMAGTDILSDSVPLVIFSSSCWLSDKGLYNRFTKKFIPAEGVVMSEEETTKYVSAMKKLVNCRLQMTPYIIENNYYAKILF